MTPPDDTRWIRRYCGPWDGAERARQFLRDVEHEIRTNWSPLDQFEKNFFYLVVFKRHLASEAKAWFRKLPNPTKTSWDATRDRFKEKYVVLKEETPEMPETPETPSTRPHGASPRTCREALPVRPHETPSRRRNPIVPSFRQEVMWSAQPDEPRGQAEQQFTYVRVPEGTSSAPPRGAATASYRSTVPWDASDAPERQRLALLDDFGATTEPRHSRNQASDTQRPSNPRAASRPPPRAASRGPARSPSRSPTLSPRRRRNQSKRRRWRESRRVRTPVVSESDTDETETESPRTKKKKRSASRLRASPRDERRRKKARRST